MMTETNSDNPGPDATEEVHRVTDDRRRAIEPEVRHLFGTFPLHGGLGVGDIDLFRRDDRVGNSLTLLRGLAPACRRDD